MANAETRRPKFSRREMVANRYGVVVRTVDRWSRSGVIPAPVYVGRLPLWSNDALDAADAAASANAKATA
jgi:predicted site-specific integrase-resolvase